MVLSDASSSNEAVHLQQRLRSLSTELVTLRNRLHVTQPTNGSSPAGGTGVTPTKSAETSVTLSAPAVPPRTTIPQASTPNGIGHASSYTLTASAIIHPNNNHAGVNRLNHITTRNNLMPGNCSSDLTNGPTFFFHHHLIFTR